MINRRPLLLLAGTVLLLTAAYAQRRKPSAKGKTPVLVAKGGVPSKPVLDVAIGRSSDKTGGLIAKATYDAIAPQGIRLVNPQGAFIEGFSFTYGERNLYEDSAGNEKIVTDYLTEYCMGDTLSPIIHQTIAQRTKPGDTAYYDDIHIRLPDGKPALGRPMKFVITR